MEIFQTKKINKMLSVVKEWKEQMEVVQTNGACLKDETEMWLQADQH